MAPSAFAHSCRAGPFWTTSPVWITIFPLKNAQFSTIQLLSILKSAGFDSERNCVSVIQNIEKALSWSGPSRREAADAADADGDLASASWVSVVALVGVLCRLWPPAASTSATTA